MSYRKTNNRADRLSKFRDDLANIGDVNNPFYRFVDSKTTSNVEYLTPEYLNSEQYEEDKFVSTNLVDSVTLITYNTYPSELEDIDRNQSALDLSIIAPILVLVWLILYFILGKRRKANIISKSVQEPPQIRDKSTEEETQKNKPICSEQINKTNYIATVETDIIEKNIQTEIISLSEISNLLGEKQSKTIIIPEKEEYSKEKHIGYNPINIFAQTEPLYYPYVLMPKSNSIIKFPRKGRRGRKGYKEEAFKSYINKYFKSNFQVFDDLFILTKNNLKPFEPDFTIIDEKNNINIFLDIEIDEPYEGTNDIQKRKPSHFQYSDVNRNNAFVNRGWIVIRFAEIQVHREPESCCKFIADVLKSINPVYIIPDSLTNYHEVKLTRRWTKDQSEQWSAEKYREKYLGITRFGSTEESELFTEVSETELGEKIEELIKDDKLLLTEVDTKKPNAKLEKMHFAINSSTYLSFLFKDKKTIVKPLKINETTLTAFCYIKNMQIVFPIHQIREIQIKNSYYTFRATLPSIGLDQITNAINIAITYQKYIRIRYTRSSWTKTLIDHNTGVLFTDRREPEESLRTINDVQLSINVLEEKHINTYKLNSNHITAYCNKREKQRTFRFDRIREIEILDL